jgi:hypothetical protein
MHGNKYPFRLREVTLDADRQDIPSGFTDTLRVYWPAFEQFLFQHPAVLKECIAEVVGCLPEEVILFDDEYSREIFVPSKDTPGTHDRVVLTM